MLVRPCDQNVPEKVVEARPAGYIHRKATEVVQGPGGVTKISDLAWSRHGVGSAELSQISVDREVFRVLLGLPPSPKENRV